jgi:energy-converting hydrogenase Eha subunit B
MRDALGVVVGGLKNPTLCVIGFSHCIRVGLAGDIGSLTPTDFLFILLYA